MKTANKEKFLKHSSNTLSEIYDSLCKLQNLRLEELEHDKTSLIIIDLINGFTTEGTLKSQRVESLINEAARVMERCKELSIPTIVFGDCHKADSPEFISYAPHCIEGTSECEIVEEIKALGGYNYINKNSTNGFIEEKFFEWLCENKAIENFIIIGDCSDICIEQFGVTLKAWFNKNNRFSRIIVPEAIVDTYDYELHDGDLMHVMALWNMLGNGLEIVNTII